MAAVSSRLWQSNTTIIINNHTPTPANFIETEKKKRKKRKKKHKNRTTKKERQSIVCTFWCGGLVLSFLYLELACSEGQPPHLGPFRILLWRAWGSLCFLGFGWSFERGFRLWVLRWGPFYWFWKGRKRLCFRLHFPSVSVFLWKCFWCIGMWRDAGTPADSFYEIRPECTDVPKTRFKIKVLFFFFLFLFSFVLLEFI